MLSYFSLLFKNKNGFNTKMISKVYFCNINYHPWNEDLISMTYNVNVLPHKDRLPQQGTLYCHQANLYKDPSLLLWHICNGHLGWNNLRDIVSTWATRYGILATDLDPYWTLGSNGKNICATEASKNCSSTVPVWLGPYTFFYFFKDGAIKHLTKWIIHCTRK